MVKNTNPQHMGGPSFVPDMDEGTPSRQVDKKSEDIREKHGADYDNYPGVRKTPDKAAKSSTSGTHRT